jgi:hypothetical protein
MRCQSQDSNSTQIAELRNPDRPRINTCPSHTLIRVPLVFGCGSLIENARINLINTTCSRRE